MTSRRKRIDDPQSCSRLLAPVAAELVERAGLEVSIEIAAKDGEDLDVRVDELLATLVPARAAFLRLQQLAAVGELAAGVTHETRNLLTSIAGFSQLARQRNGNGDSAKRYVELIEREALRAVEMLEGFLLLARVNDHEPDLVQVGQVIAEVVSATTHQAGMRRITIVTSVRAELPKLRCRRGELTQVLLNLVINAIHASPDHGRIEIVAQQAADVLELAVRDSGGGVPVELREKIFEPFFTTKAGNGTGLGLALCRRFVTAAGGTIQCRASEVGGAEMLIRFPGETFP